jgi:hypothetical protein
MALSLLLTLLAVPVIYSILDDFGTWMRRQWSGRFELDRPSSV